MLRSTLCILIISVPLLFYPGQSLAEQSVSNNRVLLIVKDNCSACDDELVRLKAPGGTFDSLSARGWKIGESSTDQIQIINAATIEPLIKKWSIEEFPTVAYIEGDQIIRSFKDGCSTPLDAYTFGWLMKGISERPTVPIPSEITVASTSNYQLRGNHWNIEGNWSASKDYILHHLRGPNHSHLYPQSWPIENWSVEELRSLHDDLHEINRPRTPLNQQLDPGNSVAVGVYVPIQIQRPAYQSATSTSVSASSKSSTTSRPGKR